MATVINDRNIAGYVRNYITSKNLLPEDMRNKAIGDWNVTEVTNMRSLFSGYETFDEPLFKWDTTNVLNMSGMFDGCNNFNQDISNWNVSEVTNMNNMFRGCINFNQDISHWDVSKVKTMFYMFRDCRRFNQNLHPWNITGVTDMTGLFRGCINLNINPNWHISPATTIVDMFLNTPLGNVPVQPIEAPAFEIHNAFDEFNF